MAECELCGNDGSRMQINHKELGRIMVCRECWKKINEEGLKVFERSESGDSGGYSCPSCGI